MRLTFRRSFQPTLRRHRDGCLRVSDRAIFAAALMAVPIVALPLLAGCVRSGPAHDAQALDRKLALPSGALLRPSAPPHCAADAMPSLLVPLPTRPLDPFGVGVKPSGERSRRDGLAYSLQLEFERDCLAAAEQTARRRLERLQAAVKRAVRTARRIEARTRSAVPEAVR